MKSQTREWVSKDKRWAGMLTTTGSKVVLELHPERRYALTRLNNQIVKAQNLEEAQ